MVETCSEKGCDILIYVNTGPLATPVWTAVGGQRGATLSEERDMIDKSNKLSVNRAREYGYGFYSWSISCDGVHIRDETAYNHLRNALRNSVSVKVRIKEQDTYTMEGFALVSSQELDSPYEDEATYSMELQGTGPITQNPV